MRAIEKKRCNTLPIQLYLHRSKSHTHHLYHPHVCTHTMNRHIHSQLVKPCRTIIPPPLTSHRFPNHVSYKRSDQNRPTILAPPRAAKNIMHISTKAFHASSYKSTAIQADRDSRPPAPLPPRLLPTNFAQQRAMPCPHTKPCAAHR